jgi:hypothetical protein
VTTHICSIQFNFLPVVSHITTTAKTRQFTYALHPHTWPLSNLLADKVAEMGETREFSITQEHRKTPIK